MKTEPKHEPLLSSTPPYHLRTRPVKPQHQPTTQPPSSKQPPRKKPKKTSPPSTTLPSTSPTLFENLKHLSDYLDAHLPVLMFLTLQLMVAILLFILAVLVVWLVVGLPLSYLWTAAGEAWTWVSGPDKGWGLGEGRCLCLGEVQGEVPGSLLLAMLALVVL
jgi:hypothetical protein